MFTAAISIYLAFLYLYNRRQTEKKNTIVDQQRKSCRCHCTALHCTQRLLIR